MGTHRSLKNGGNWSLKESKMGVMGKDGKTLPGRALFIVRRSWALSKRMPLPPSPIVRIP